MKDAGPFVEQFKVLDAPYSGFWMASAYRIPDNPCACTEPGVAPARTIPIGRFNVRSFITSVSEGTRVRAGEAGKER